MKKIFAVILLSISINSYSQIVLTGTSTPVTCSNSCNGTITLASANATGTVTYTIGSVSQSSPVFTGLCAGTYIATATDQLPSTSTFTIIVSSPGPLNYTVNTIDETIPFSCDGSATVNITGGTAPYTVTWYSSTMTVLQTGASTTISNLCSGTYYVVVTDNNGCTGNGPLGSSPTQFTINFMGMPCQISTYNVSPVSCFGTCDGSITLVSTGGTLPYTVIHPVTSAVITYTGSTVISGLCAGTYTLAIDDASGICDEFLTVSVSQPTALSTSPMASNESAPGACDGSISGSASGGTSPYVWSINNFSTSQPNGNFNNLCAGSYNYCVEDNNGCQTCTTVTVGSSNCGTLTSAVVQNVPVTCFGACNGSVTIITTGGTSPYIVDVNGTPYTSIGAVTLTNLCAGTYGVLVTDANNCLNTLGFTITQPQQLSVSVSGTAGAGCTGSITATPTGGTGPYTYNWLTCPNANAIGQNSVTAQGLCDGSYQVEVTDANGCTTTSSCVTLNSSGCNMVGTAFISSAVSCYGVCDGSIAVAATNGTAPYTVSLNGGAPFTFMSTANLPNICGGTYTVLITDAAGCTYTSMVTMPEPAQIIVTASGTAGAGCTGTLTSTVSGGNPSYVFSWINCSTSALIATTQNVINVCDGQYQVNITDINGCTATSSCVTLNSSGCNMVGTAFITSGISCNGACDGAIGVAATNGTAPYTVTLNGGAPTTFMSSTTLTNICAGNYTIVFTDATGCAYTTIVNMQQPVQIVASANTTNETTVGACDGSITASGTGGVGSFIYSIDGGTTYTGSNTFTGLCAGTYVVCVMDANGCSNCTTVTITSGNCNTLTSAVVQTVEVSCFGLCDGSATLVTTGGTNPYMVMINSMTYTYLGSVTIPNLCSGTYSAKIIDAAGCVNTLTFSITQPAQLTAVATGSNPSTASSCDGMLASTATGGTSPYIYNWINCTTGNTVGFTSPNVNNVCAGSYQVIVVDANGCADTSNCVTLSGINGIEENETTSFTVYPNPANANFTIESSNGAAYTFEMLNLLGELVLTSTSKTTSKTTIDLRSHGIAGGSYILRIQAGSGTSVHRIIIEK